MSQSHHASAVMLGSCAIMLIGAAGSGKSSLVLNLIDTQGAILVGDDRVIVSVQNGVLSVAPHTELAGLLEIRGLGLVRLPHLASAPLRLVVQLQDTPPPRLPEPSYFEFGDIKVPLLALNGHDPMNAVRIKYAAQALVAGFRDDAIYPLGGLQSD